MYKVWSLPEEPYFVGTNDASKTERIIEIPWALSCIGNARKVLDVGYAYSEGRYYKALLELNVPELHGVDYGRVPGRSVPYIENLNMKEQTWDIRSPLPYDKDYFDVILCISTIEHVGYDNLKYTGFDDRESDKRTDVDALKNLLEVLSPDGRIVLTIPYGAREKKRCFQQYDKDSFETLVNESGAKVIRKDIFVVEKNGWIVADEKAAEGRKYGCAGFASSTGLVCAIIEKDGTV